MQVPMHYVKHICHILVSILIFNEISFLTFKINKYISNEVSSQHFTNLLRCRLYLHLEKKIIVNLRLCRTLTFLVNLQCG